MHRSIRFGGSHSLGVILGVGLVASLLAPQMALGQGGGVGLGAQAVGGISIDAGGIVRNLQPAALERLAVERRSALEGGPVEAAARHALRKVSLSRIVASLRQHIETGEPLPVEIQVFGGLERITHVFVDPDGQDIVLAGPGDAGRIDAAGNLLAVTSGRPLLQLEDFLVALRAIDAARNGGFRCSIDPTPEGITRLQALLRNQRTIGQPEQTLQAMEAALGPQMISVGGVPTDSRFARVLVAADYRMKRIGMGLEPSGVSGLPSYLSLLPPTASAAAMPRFWLEPRYEPLARDPDELAWQLVGRQIVCVTESDRFDGEHMQRGQGKADPIAVQWCQRMTEHYAELAAQQPVFAELVNCVDLAVVAALIHGRQLGHRAGLDLALLLDAERLPLPTYTAPASVPTVASGVRRGNRWIVTASGGVQFQPWGFANQTVADSDIEDSRIAALKSRPASGWHWD